MVYWIFVYNLHAQREAIINKINGWVGIARTHVIKPYFKEVVGTAQKLLASNGSKIDATMVILKITLSKIESKIDKITR
jgi:hypothetical protein